MAIKRNLAIVIGINKYIHIPKLKNAVNDAEKIAKVLRERYDYKVLSLINENATYEKLQILLNNLNNKEPIYFTNNEKVEFTSKDRVLFYFAGHGFAEDAQDSDDCKPAGYFMPQNAEEKHKNTWLSMEDVYNTFNQLECHHLLMILDCCFAGRISWIGQGRSASGSRKKVYQQAYNRFINERTQQIITSAAHDEKAQDVLRFGQRAEVKEYPHSPFAYLLLKVLKGDSKEIKDKFLEAIHEDKVITVQEIYTYLQNKLHEYEHEQTPGLSKPRYKEKNKDEYNLFKGEFIFTLRDFKVEELDSLKLDESTNPYKGLASYNINDTQLFLGRKRLIEGSEDPKYPQEGLLSKVNKHPLTIVLGPSGSGKSSLVKAGLIPALIKSEEKNNQEEWYVLNPVRPGDAPFDALAKAILPLEIEKSNNISLVDNLNKIDFIEDIIESKTKDDEKLDENYKELKKNIEVWEKINQENKETSLDNKQKLNSLVNTWKNAIPKIKLLFIVENYILLTDLFQYLKLNCNVNYFCDKISRNLEWLGSLGIDKYEQLISKLKAESQSLIEFKEIIKGWSNQNPQKKLLLTIDQSEELITLCKNDEEREKFVQLLAISSKDLSEKLRIVMTLRSDYEAQIRDLNKKKHENQDWQKNWQENWQNGRFFVTPMNREELQQIIEEPAEQRTLVFESPKLVNKLIDEVIGMQGALPLLSFTLSELYLKYLKAEEDNVRKDRIITDQDYEELGGVTHSITKRANEVYDNLVGKNLACKIDPESDKSTAPKSAYEDTVRRVMLRMVSLQSGQLARRQVPKSELVYADKKENERVQEVIKCFSEARLIVAGSNPQGDSYVEPAHDALVSGWDKLLAWSREKEESLILQRQLTSRVGNMEARS